MLTVVRIAHCNFISNINPLDGSILSSILRPRSEPLLLRRVIMNTIPTFGTTDGGIIGSGKGAAAAAEEEAVAAGGEGEHGALGCCPYIQVFKSGALIFTATYR